MSITTPQCPSIRSAEKIFFMNSAASPVINSGPEAGSGSLEVDPTEVVSFSKQMEEESA